MTHPDELLAEYADDALSPQDRAEVDEHLAGCARCRDEIGLSRNAVASLRLLSDRPAPAGVTSKALEESRRTPGREAAAAARPPRWYRFAPVAAAAAVVLLLAIAIPRFTSSKNPASAPYALGAAASEATGGTTSRSVSAPVPQDTASGALNTRFDGPARGLERQSTNYDSTSLQGLAAPTAFGTFASNNSFDSAKRCVASAGTEKSGTLVRLIQARYQNTPTYVAVFLPNGLKHQTSSSPVTVVVVTTAGCSLLAVGGGAG